MDMSEENQEKPNNVTAVLSFILFSQWNE